VKKWSADIAFVDQLQGELEVPFVFLYIQVSLYCAMSFLFKPPFVAAFRNLVSLQ
jgi:hypothetical protein